MPFSLEIRAIIELINGKMEGKIGQGHARDAQRILRSELPIRSTEPLRLLLGNRRRSITQHEIIKPREIEYITCTN